MDLTGSVSRKPMEPAAPSIGDLTTRCLHRMSFVTPNTAKVIREERERLISWADAMHVWEESSRASLNHKFRLSPDIIETLRSNLRHILETLDNGIQGGIQNEKRNGTILKCLLQEDIDALVQFSSQMDSLRMGLREKRLALHVKDKTVTEAMGKLAAHTQQHMLDRFPGAPETLRAIMVAANTQRLQWLYIVRRDNMTSSAKWDDRSGSLYGGISSDNALPSIAQLATDNSSTMTFAKSHIASMLPPLPQSKICPCCGVGLASDMSESEWRAHVVSDLEPYCLLIEPGPQAITMFGEERGWMQLLEKMYSSTPSFQELTSKARSTRATTKEVRQDAQDWLHCCPFCGLKASEDASIFTDGGYQKHLAWHLCELAALVLQHLPKRIRETTSVGGSGGTPIEPPSLRGDTLPADAAAVTSQASITGTKPSVLSQLQDACLVRSEELLGKLLSEADVVRLEDIDGRRAMHWAARCGFTKGVHMLQKHGCAVNVVDGHGLSPFTAAVIAGKCNTVRILVALSADDRHRDDITGWTAVHYAAEEGHRDVVEFLVERESESVHAKSSEGVLPLHCAAFRGHVDVVMDLLQRGADPAGRNDHGWTALHYAAFAGRSEVVELLLRERSGKKARGPLPVDADGWSPLHLAVHTRHAEVARLLTDAKFSAPVETVAEPGAAMEWLAHSRPARDAISQQAFLKAISCNSLTELRDAAAKNDFETTRKLLALEKDVDGTNSGGRTALFQAALNARPMMLELLLRERANPARVPDGYVAWEEFISDEEVLKQLRDAGYKRPRDNGRVKTKIRTLLAAVPERRKQPPRAAKTNRPRYNAHLTGAGVKKASLRGGSRK